MKTLKYFRKNFLEMDYFRNLVKKQRSIVNEDDDDGGFDGLK
jgi:hypothetical protein